MRSLPCWLILLSVAAYPFGATSDEVKPPTAPAETKAVEPISDKPFIIYRINDWSPVILVDDYGFMLINDGIDETPSPRFVIAFKSSRTLIDTKDLKIAALALKMIPMGSRIRLYESCTMPRSYGLQPLVRLDLNVAIKNAGLSVLKEPNITCYCGPE